MVKINRYFKTKGFTLLELLIVVIIVGILASLALPRFLRAAETARWAEARQMCGVIRGSQMRREVFTDVLNELDVEIPANGTFFDFACDTAAASLATATRNGVDDAEGLSGETISIADTGAWTYSGGVPAWLQ